MARALEGRAALVTGSTDGIGLATAHALAAQGCAVMLNGFGEPDAIAVLRRELAQAHDVERRARRCRPARRTGGQRHRGAGPRKRFGRLDILVNNAGTQHKGPVEEHPPQRWREVMALNLDARLPHTIRTALPGDARARLGAHRQRGLGLRACRRRGPQAATCASKHGTGRADEGTSPWRSATTAITCNAVCPGDVSDAHLLLQRRSCSPSASRSPAPKRSSASRPPTCLRAAWSRPSRSPHCVAFLCSEAAAEIRRRGPARRRRLAGAMNPAVSEKMDATTLRRGALSHLRAAGPEPRCSPALGRADAGRPRRRSDQAWSAPASGDDSRRLGPPFLRDDAGEPTRRLWLSPQRQPQQEVGHT